MRPSHQPKIVLRIGINLGDVIIEGDDIYGDGVNIAARLEPLAEPGGICVSSIVNESVGNRIDVRFQDGGDISVKNIDRPIRVWKWHPGATPDRYAKAQRRPKPDAQCRDAVDRHFAVHQHVGRSRSRNISPTASAKTSSPTCRRSPA